MIRPTLIALGMALASTGAWAQAPTDNCVSVDERCHFIAASCVPRIDELRRLRECGIGFTETSQAQDPPVASVPPPRNGELAGFDKAGNQTITLPGAAQIIAPGIQLSTTIAGTVELSPDQKLARAYALCIWYGFSSMTIDHDAHYAHTDFVMKMRTEEPCTTIIHKFRLDDPKLSDADRAFIEEVARSLK